MEHPVGDVFQAIADPTRRRLLEFLVDGERSVGRLADRFDASRPAISQHLGVLLRAGLVVERRVGRERRYRLEPARLREVSNWLRQYDRFWQDRLEALGEHLDNTP